MGKNKRSWGALIPRKSGALSALSAGEKVSHVTEEKVIT